SGLKFAEWEYGPQKRLLASITGDHEFRSGFFKRFKSILSYQTVEESRITRSFGSTSRTVRTEDVDVLGYTVYLDREAERHDVRAGIDGQLSTVQSTAFSENILDGTLATASTRYPSGGNAMGNHALFVSHTWKISPQFILNDGLRLTFTSLYSKFYDTTFYPFPFREVEQTNTALCGNLGLVYRPAERWKFSLLGSSGFRSPNVDDLAKVFDSSPGSVIMPNPELGPERLWSVESSVGLRIGEVYFEGTAFHSWFDRAIVILPGTFNGSDSIIYDGVQSAVRTSFNERSAFVQGLSGSMEAELGKRLHFVASVTYTKGRIVEGGGQSPLDHIPPVFGRISLRYDYKSMDIESFFLFNGKKPISEYLLNGEDNERYALPQGMPSWSTLNFRASWKASKLFKLQAGIDNVFDVNYRTFSSGIQAPGRNFIFAVRVGF
ncbi:MAG: TonB-dependent receptor plug domain-containing protein, partial [Bacteroidota bacterium]